MRVQIWRKIEMYGISKFIRVPRIKLLNVDLKQKGKSLLKKQPKNETNHHTIQKIKF